MRKFLVIWQHDIYNKLSSGEAPVQVVEALDLEQVLEEDSHNSGNLFIFDLEDGTRFKIQPSYEAKPIETYDRA